LIFYHALERAKSEKHTNKWHPEIIGDASPELKLGEIQGAAEEV